LCLRNGILLRKMPGGSKPPPYIKMERQTEIGISGEENGADYRGWWMFVHKIVYFCFHFSYRMFKTVDYDHYMKGGGSREPLPFL